MYRDNRLKSKLLGGLPYGARSWQDLLDGGFHLTTAGSDLGLMRTACVEVVQQYRARKRG